MRTIYLTLKTTFEDSPQISSNIEREVYDWIINWHLEDGLQEEINMGLQSSGIRAGVVKVGGPPNTLAFQVHPYPSQPKKGFVPSKFRR